MNYTDSGSPEDDIVDQTEPGLAFDTATVTITGTGVAITRSVDEATMSAVIALLFGGPAARQGAAGTTQQPQRQQTHQLPPGSGGVTNAPQWNPELTLGEFLVETEARTFPQKIAAAGYFKLEFEHQGSFDRDAIRSALVEAHEDLPGNFARDFASAASHKLIAAKSGEPGKYFVTTTGKKAVESKFQDVPKRKAPKRRKTSVSSNGEDSG